VLEQFWRARGYLQELEDWIWQLLERHDVKDPLHVRAMAVYSACTPDLTQACIFAEKGLQLARMLSDKQLEALSLMVLGAVISYQGNLREGMPLVEQSLALYQVLGNKLGQAIATVWLSHNNNDLARSKAYIMESLRLNRDLGHLWGIAVCLADLAEKTIWEGDISSPAQWLEEARIICRQLGAQLVEAIVLRNYGSLTFWRGDYPQACTYFEEAIVLDQRVGNRASIYWSCVNLSYALLRQGNILKAKDTFDLCIQQFQRVNNQIGLVYAIEGLASLHVNQNQPERAARLFAWSDVMRDKIGDHRPPVEQSSVKSDLAAIRSKLNDTTFEKAWAAGEMLTTEQAINLALKDEQ
jgi:tetratricopeptide (TPR) repeat protein